MKVLFIGDIIGRAGRRAVRELTPKLVIEHAIDLVIANGENAAGGFGINPKCANELYECGVDLITTGNHIWDKKEIIPFLEEDHPIVRPGNYPPGSPGKSSYLLETAGGEKLTVINASGRVFMDNLDCPFRFLDSEVEKAKSRGSAIVVDFHAEATSEKNAMGIYLDGRISALVGSHTHVQTADEKVMSGGTGYITDAGMTGATESIIGMKTDGPLSKFLTAMPRSFEPARGNIELQGAVLNIDSASGKCISIERVKKAL